MSCRSHGLFLPKKQGHSYVAKMRKVVKRMDIHAHMIGGVLVNGLGSMPHAVAKCQHAWASGAEKAALLQAVAGRQVVADSGGYVVGDVARW